MRILAVTIIMLMTACTKRLDVQTPSLTVSLDAAHLVADTFVYKLGDTTKFMFSGNAANIAFYPGDTGHAYDNRNRNLALGTITLSFTSKAEFGTQTNTLQLLATNKLNGLDSASVVNAAWTDITGKAALAGSATEVNSGTINLNDLVSNENDSLFIAFKYSGVTGTTQRTWTITNFLVSNVLPDLSYTLSSLSMDISYWTRYGNVWNPANARWTPTTTQLRVIGGGGASPSNTSWIVSKPLYVGRVAPDVSIALKSINNPDLTGYNYKYTAAGTYKATFVTFNNTAEKQETVVQQFYIKVTL